jgi:CRP-like cAMP-binding protein
VSPRHVPASVSELARVGLLVSLPGERLVALAERMRREDVAPGTVILREGEPGERFYVLLQGMVAVSQTHLGPRRLLRPGDYFGEVAAAMDIPRTATVTAITPCVVASCDRAAFDEYVFPLFKEGKELESLADDV